MEIELELLLGSHTSYIVCFRLFVCTFVETYYGPYNTICIYYKYRVDICFAIIL